MTYLLDTNVVSELRRGPRADRGVLEWFEAREADELALSVVTIGEIRQGLEQLRRRDRPQAELLDRWLRGLTQFYGDRLLDIDGDVTDEWGRLRAGRGVPVIDALLAATARVRGLTLVTRNVRDFAGLHVRLLSPFSGA
ncbi:MAG: ribonuclease VapC [Acidimicrobiia bacterium]